MNRILLGSLLGIVLGLVDVAMTLAGHHPEISTLTLSQAFSSRFAIGLLAANVRLGAPGAIAGGLAGLLISLPDAFALKRGRSGVANRLPAKDPKSEIDAPFSRR